MAMGQVFFWYPPRPASTLMRRDLILINGFGTSMRFFLKPEAGSGIAPFRSTPIIYKINLNLNFKINLI